MMLGNDINTCAEVIRSIDLGFMILEMIRSEDLFDRDFPIYNYDSWRINFAKSLKTKIK